MADEYLPGTQGPVRLVGLTKQKIDIAASGSVISNATGPALRVYQLVLSVATTVTVTFKSGSTALTGAMTINAGVPLVLPFSELGWLDVNATEDLVLTLGSSVQVSGTLIYSQLA